jgi:hypothetical protein
MITQHVVSFGSEITLTRLPAGRAEGFVWLSFVARGIEMTPGPEDVWRIHDHIRLGWLDGSAPEVVEGGVNANETLHLFYVTVRDAGFNTLTIHYVEDDQVISSENVALPAAPAA